MITACIVLYKNNPQVLSESIYSFLNSGRDDSFLYLVDNSPTEELKTLIASPNVEYIHNPSNPGFGAAHNIAIKKAIAMGSKYHLVLNPDVYFDEKVLSQIVDFMDDNPKIGNVLPKVLYPDGSIQYLAKLLPTPSDWIALLDSDDVWHMDKLQIMSKYFDSGFSLLAHNFTLKPFEQLAKNPKEKIIFIKDILLRNCMVTPSIIMKKSLDFKFDENMKYAEDHELWLRIIDKEKKALFVDLPLVKLDRAVLSSGGASSNIWRMRKGEIKMYIKYFSNKSQYLFLLPFFITFSLLKFILTILNIKFLKSRN